MTPRSSHDTRRKRTRRVVVEAATALFVERGYAATTMADIAAAAGVAVQTLYLAFDGKDRILAAAHDVAIAGDDEPLPVLERPWVQAIRDEPDLSRAVEVLVDNVRAGAQRSVHVYGVIQRSADDRAVGELYRELQQQRHRTWRVLSRSLAAKQGARRSAKHIADVLYALASVEQYQQFVDQRRWSARRWARWLHRTLVADFTSPTASSRPDRGRTCNRDPDHKG